MHCCVVNHLFQDIIPCSLFMDVNKSLFDECHIFKVKENTPGHCPLDERQDKGNRKVMYDDTVHRQHFFEPKKINL